MSDLKATLSVRRGHYEDRQAVLAIDKDVYGGQDYLPAAYNTYCDDPNRINYILEADGLAVAYFGATIVDEGHGAFLQAARTRQGHRKRGYQIYLKKAAAADLKTHFPNMKEILFNAYGATPDDTLLYRVGGHRRILHAKPFCFFSLSREEDLLAARSAMAEQRHYTEAVRNIEFSKFLEFSKRADFKRHFPAERVLIHYVPYNLDVPSNFSLPYRFPDFFQLSYNQGEIDGVSFHNVYYDKERDWERHEFEIYCQTMETCLKLFAFCLHSCIEGVKSRIIQCTALYPICLDKIRLESALEGMFGVSLKKPLGDDINYVNLICDTGYFS